MLEDYMEMGKMVAKWLTEHPDINQVYDHKAVENIRVDILLDV